MRPTPAMDRVGSMKHFALLVLLTAGGCVNPLRTAAERENVNLSKSLATAYFGGQPIPTPLQQELTWKAIADIERRLDLEQGVRK